MQANKNSTFSLITDTFIIPILWLVVILLAGEFCLRSISFFKKDSRNPYELSGIVYNRLLGWRLKKNMTRKYYRTNSHGFRDFEYSIEKDNTINRIMFLGDSYTFGGGFPFDTILTGVFKKNIDEYFNGALSCEVMNISIPAWATDQKLIYLENEGMNYLPNYLILMVAPNDIRECYAKQIFTLNEGEN